MARRFKKPKFPYPFFHLLEEGVDVGVYAAADFGDNGNGEWVCQGAGSPLFLRIVRQRGSEIQSLDGAGVEHHYTMEPVLP